MDTRFSDAEATLVPYRTQLAELVIGKQQAEYRLGLEIASCTGLSLLVTGHSGTGKTFGIKTASVLCGASFARIQVTPDTMPGDIIDVMVFNQETRKMERRTGVIRRGMFVFIDELNRGGERVQNTLNEALEERQVTLDGDSLPLEEPSIVVAAQNPGSYLGTEDMTEAVADRFAMSVASHYPTPEEEVRINKMRAAGNTPEAVLDPDTLKEFRYLNLEVVKNGVSEDVHLYVAQMVAKLRTDDFVMKASVRDSWDILRAAAHMAIADGRAEVMMEDINTVILMCVRGRVQLAAAVSEDQKDVELKRKLEIR